MLPGMGKTGSGKSGGEGGSEDHSGTRKGLSIEGPFLWIWEKGVRADW